MQVELTRECLRMVVASFIPLIRRQLVDHLEGGVLTSLSDAQQESVKFAPKHNILGERIFGELDKSMADKPNMTALHRETSILYPHNRTGNWLQSATESDQRQYLGAARKLGPIIQKRWKEQQGELRRQRQDLLERRFVDTAARASRKAERLRVSINDTLWCGGIWGANNYIDNLTALSDGDQAKAVRVQLKYHKCSDFKLKPSKLTSLSEKGRPKSSDELRANLVLVLQQLFEASTTTALSNADAVFSTEQRRANLDVACERYLSVAEKKGRGGVGHSGASGRGASGGGVSRRGATGRGRGCGQG
jgi:hypothetical protein